MSRVSWRLCATALLLQAFLTAQSEPVGALLEKTGNWMLDGKPAVRGTPVRQGQELLLPNGELGAAKVLYFNATRAKCGSFEDPPCRKLKVELILAPQAPVNQRVRNLLVGMSASYLRAGSALSRSTSWPDQIAERLGSELRLLQALPNNANLEFLRLDVECVPAAKGVTAMYGGGLRIPVRLEPGLYHVNVLSLGGQPSGDHFWLLVSPNSVLAETTADYATLQQATSAWPVADSSLSEKVLRSFLHSRAFPGGQ